MTSFYNEDELNKLGLKAYGKGVLISRKASLYDIENIEIGNNVRIDDFCILSGKVALSNYIHISAYSALYGGKTGIIMNDYSGMSARTIIYAENDDYSGEWMSNSMLDEKYRNVYRKKVVIGKYVQIGSGSIILPGSFIGEGAAIGAMSLVKDNIQDWIIAAGIPAKFIRKRKKTIQKIADEIENSVDVNLMC